MHHLHSGIVLGDDLELSTCTLGMQLLHSQAKRFHGAGNVIHDCTVKYPGRREAATYTCNSSGCTMHSMWLTL